MNWMFWIVIAVVVGFAIWWIIDWHDKFPDGE
jgi:hypothetical protein